MKRLLTIAALALLPPTSRKRVTPHPNCTSYSLASGASPMQARAAYTTACAADNPMAGSMCGQMASRRTRWIARCNPHHPIGAASIAHSSLAGARAKPGLRTIGFVSMPTTIAICSSTKRMPRSPESQSEAPPSSHCGPRAARHHRAGRLLTAHNAEEVSRDLD